MLRSGSACRFDHRLLFAVVSVTLAMLVAACEDPPPKPPIEDSPAGRQVAGGSSDGGVITVVDSGVKDSSTPVDAGACTDVSAESATINQQAIIGDVPQGTGGTIADGTYQVTDATFYVNVSGVPGLTGASYQGRIRVTGTTFERHLIFKSSSGAVAETLVKGTFVQGGGGNATLSLTCPFATQESVSFSVNGASVVLSNLVTKESLIFTRIN